MHVLKIKKITGDKVLDKGHLRNIPLIKFEKMSVTRKERRLAERKAKAATVVVDDSVETFDSKKKNKNISAKVSVTKKLSEVNEDSDLEEEEEEYNGASASESESDAKNENENGFDNDSGIDGENEPQQSNPNPNKKSKIESRSEAKKVKLERQSHRPHNETVQAAKKLWEQVRRRDLDANSRAGPLGELFALLTGKFKEMLAKHDASRMIQTCVKYGNPTQRLQLAVELTGAYAEISKSRYGKHIVKRLLQFCPSVRKTIVGEFRGQVGKLIRHADGSAVLEQVYTDWANGRERNALLVEFYGPEFALFQQTANTTLSSIMSDPGVSVEKREGVLKALREALDGLINKGILQHSIVHRLMLEYVCHEPSVARIQDWISTFEDKLVEILHTFEGSRVVSRCLALATAKQRKTILKSFKPFIAKISREEYGHQVLLVAFALVDDTVLMRSVVLSELCKDLRGILDDKFASRLVVFLLASATDSANAVLPAQSLQLVKECVECAAKAGTSKKDPILRSAELRTDLIQPVTDLIGASEMEDLEINATTSYRMDSLLDNPSKHQLLLEAALAIPEVSAKLLNGPATDLNRYEDADFRALMKKWARKCSSDQGVAFLDLLTGRLAKRVTESEAAYILIALIATKPELKPALLNLVDQNSENEHTQVLLQKLRN
jgi:pumilio homology domain family member 6